MVNLVFKWCEQGFRPLEKGLLDVKGEMVLQGPWIPWLVNKLASEGSKVD